jgi:hypothetical protein
MRYWLWVLILPLAACGGDQTGRLDHPLGRKLTEQVMQSCEQGLAYHKVVIDHRQSPPTREDSVLSPVPQVPFGEAQDGSDSTNYLLLRDLAYAAEKYYDDPYLIDNLEVSRSQDTLIARVQPKKADDLDLQTQKLLYQADSTLRFVETRLQKSSWLYAMGIDMRLHFDSLGRYQRHHLDVVTKVPLLNRTFRAVVEGEGRYGDGL